MKRFFSTTNSLLKQIKLKSKPFDMPVPMPVLTSPQKVAFNLAKIRSLSGMEKIELLRDYYKQKQTNEAMFVYRIIRHYGFVNRLQYSDFHNVFHLAIRDVVANKEFLQELHTDAVSLHSMSINYLNDYLICCCKWGDEEGIANLLERIQNVGEVSTNGWEHILDHYLSTQNYEKGIEMLERIKKQTPVVRPSRKMYTQGIELYGAAGDTEKALDFYLEAEENMNRLAHEQLEKRNYSELEQNRWKVESTILMFSKFLNVLVANDGDANSAYDTFISSTPIKGSKNGLKLYHILFKYLQKHKSVEHAKKYWADMKSFDLKPDFLIYSRMLSLQTTPELAMEWYKLASVSFSLSKFQKQALDSSLVMTLMDLNAVDEAYDMILRFEVEEKNLLLICYKRMAEFVKADTQKAKNIELILQRQPSI